MTAVTHTISALERWNPTRQSLTTHKVAITPELAEYWRQFANPNNRQRIDRHIATLARAIKAGQFTLTSDHIAFDETGMLINGHHRIEAIIASGCTVEALVDFGIPRVCISNIDRNAIRTHGQIWHMAGIPNANDVAAMCGQVYLYERGTPFQHYPVNQFEMRAIYDRDPEKAQRIRNGTRCIKKHLPVTASVLSAMWYITDSIDNDTATLFFGALHDGAGLSAGSPILSLRDRIVNSKLRNEQVQNFELGIWIAKAWNAVRAGRQMRMIRRVDNEGFPTLL